MASSKFLITVAFLLFLSSRPRPGSCQLQQPSENLAKCFEKLAPCKDYLQADEISLECCGSVKQSLADDPTCLCALYQDQPQATNIGEEWAELPGKCGVENFQPDWCTKYTDKSEDNLAEPKQDAVSKATTLPSGDIILVTLPVFIAFSNC